VHHNPDCTLCVLGTDAKPSWIRCQPTVWDSGSQPPQAHTPLLLILGERPGADEATTGIPFTGIAGTYLRGRTPDSVFSHWDLRQRACIYLANAVRCPCPADTVPATCFKTCTDTYLRPHLDHLAHLPHSRLVALLMGAPAVQHWYRLGGIPSMTLTRGRNQQGTRITIGSGIWHTVCTYNPGAILREPARHLELTDHMSIIDRLLRGESLPNPRPTLVPPGPPPPSSSSSPRT